MIYYVNGEAAEGGDGSKERPTLAPSPTLLTSAV